MPFVSMTELLQDARARNYALPAFNIWTFQDVLAYVRAAEEAVYLMQLLSSAGKC
jgi:fructose/tagatose bisphosphate aldolase